jgi:hypothetical protein
MIGALERVGSRAWSLHFRLNRFVWWFAGLILLAVGVIVPIDDVHVTAPVLALVAFAGGVRWQRARRRCKSAMLVPLFFEGGGAGGHAEEAQRIVVDTLREHLPRQSHDIVQPLAVVVGPDERAFAEKTRKRLRASFILHGRVAARKGGGWSVFPRILEPAYNATTHVDWFTRDRTPASPRFGPLVSTLKPQIGVLDEEFPFEFCRDLEALLRGITGRIALAVGENERAIELLDEALLVAGESTNHQIDALRSSRALALAELDDMDGAIESLRARAEGENPSPALLRELAHLLLRRANAEAEAGGTPDPGSREEMIRVLRLARSDETDPHRDQSTYNLFGILDRGGVSEQEREENYALLDELLESRTRYRRQWYVKRAAGVRAWHGVMTAWAAGDRVSEKEAGKEAGRWYSRAIRARPLLQYAFVGLSRRPLRFHRIPPSPILYANARDGHELAGHRIRTWWLERRFTRIRTNFMKRGWNHLKALEWSSAYPYYDWVRIVGRNDDIEGFAHTYAAACLWKQGKTREAEQMWADALSRSPAALLPRANLVFHFELWGIDPSVPGKEPTDQAGVEAILRQAFGDNPSTQKD